KSPGCSLRRSCLRACAQRGRSDLFLLSSADCGGVWQKELAMPRKQRMYLPGVPAHVVQRGNNRDACFFQDEDYQFYLAVLADALRRYRVHLHAYVLMTNHVHLLMTPSDESGISRVMQHLGRMYVLYV